MELIDWPRWNVVLTRCVDWLEHSPVFDIGLVDVWVWHVSFDRVMSSLDSEGMSRESCIEKIYEYHRWEDFVLDGVSLGGFFLRKQHTLKFTCVLLSMRLWCISPIRSGSMVLGRMREKEIERVSVGTATPAEQERTGNHPRSRNWATSWCLQFEKG
jgi:hypothetical protein